MIIGNIIKHHGVIRIFNIGLKFRDRLALRHDFRVLQQFSKPKPLALPIDHFQMMFHDVSLTKKKCSLADFSGASQFR